MAYPGAPGVGTQVQGLPPQGTSSPPSPRPTCVEESGHPKEEDAGGSLVFEALGW